MECVAPRLVTSPVVVEFPRHSAGSVCRVSQLSDHAVMSSGVSTSPLVSGVVVVSGAMLASPR